MDGERISLRLGREELELLDRFIEEHAEFSNRSQLARVALHSFIEAKGTQVPEMNELEIPVKIPRAALGVMEGMVRAGIYNSIGGAIEDCVRKEFVPKEYFEDVKRKIFETKRETLEVVPD
ncbi:MAG: ribbon-helix-helix domain-containing protein [Methanomassiliicoccales archaeon]|nr:ribbon-helix-helix domain-containing protein [Methanomassiliicoccales archaeon]